MPVSVALISLAISLAFVASTDAASAPAIPHSYPATINIYMYPKGHICGGAILTRDYILTSAHCVMGLKNDQIYIWVGDHRLNDKEIYEQNHLVNQIIIHKKYDERNKVHDIAVINVFPPIEFSDKINCANTPYCTADKYDDLEGVVVGWSTWNFENGYPSPELMEGTVKILSYEECKKKVPQIPKPKYVICAEGDLCAGDTGGPLYLKKQYHNEQIGLASYTHGSCEKGVTVFTKLSTYAGWLHRRLSG